MCTKLTIPKVVSPKASRECTSLSLGIWRISMKISTSVLGMIAASIVLISACPDQQYYCQIYQHGHGLPLPPLWDDEINLERSTWAGWVIVLRRFSPLWRYAYTSLREGMESLPRIAIVHTLYWDQPTIQIYGIPQHVLHRKFYLPYTSGRNVRKWSISFHNCFSDE